MDRRHVDSASGFSRCISEIVISVVTQMNLVIIKLNRRLDGLDAGVLNGERHVECNQGFFLMGSQYTN